MRAQPILRTSLRQQVYASLLRMLLDGRWDEDSRVNDSALATELGVSRTPVREALIQLESEGLLVCDPHRGFSLPPLDAREAREIYPILWSLEQLAVYLHPGSAQELRKTLEQANGRGGGGQGLKQDAGWKPAAQHADSAAALKQDRAWHAALVGASGNERLIEMTTRVEALSRRYAAALVRDGGCAERRTREHAQIAEALAMEQPARAFALLKMHWRAEMDEVVKGLEERGGTAANAEMRGKAAAGKRVRAAAGGRA
jgi:DNA-binding GntR family transcriptional regulator